jgi:hypothetical protein
VGAIYDQPDLEPGETVELRLGAGFFPSKAFFSRGGLLYVTNKRLFFRPQNLDKTFNRSDAAVDLRMDEITAVGTTPPWSVAMGRRFLRVDAGDNSYLFLFSVRHPRWRQKVISGVLRQSQTAVPADGWGAFT